MVTEAVVGIEAAWRWSQRQWWWQRRRGVGHRGSGGGRGSVAVVAEAVVVVEAVWRWSQRQWWW